MAIALLVALVAVLVLVWGALRELRRR